MHSILRCATVVDGTGGPRRQADVEVIDGRIAASGRSPPAKARKKSTSRVSCCTGLRRHPHAFRRPGFRGTATLSPSSWHGVTTVVQGNCGFGSRAGAARGPPARRWRRSSSSRACRLADAAGRDRLAVSNLSRSISTCSRQLPKSINIAAFVPHYAMCEFYVMGRRRGSPRRRRATSSPGS